MLAIFCVVLTQSNQPFDLYIGSYLCMHRLYLCELFICSVHCYWHRTGLCTAKSHQVPIVEKTCIIVTLSMLYFLFASTYHNSTMQLVLTEICGKGPSIKTVYRFCVLKSAVKWSIIMEASRLLIVTLLSK